GEVAYQRWFHAAILPCFPLPAALPTRGGRGPGRLIRVLPQEVHVRQAGPAEPGTELPQLLLPALVVGHVVSEVQVRQVAVIDMVAGRPREGVDRPAERAVTPQAAVEDSPAPEVVERVARLVSDERLDAGP